MNRSDKIEFIKGIMSGYRDPFELKRLPDEILIHVKGSQYRNVKTGEIKTLPGGGEGSGAAFFLPDLNHNGGTYFFCVDLETVYATKNLKKGTNYNG